MSKIRNYIARIVFALIFVGFAAADLWLTTKMDLPSWMRWMNHPLLLAGVFLVTFIVAFRLDRHSSRH